MKDWDIIQVLEIGAGFFNKNIQSSGEQNLQGRDRDPSSIGKLVSEQDLATTVKTIETYKQYLENQRDSLKAGIIKTQVLCDIISPVFNLLGRNL